MVRSRVRASTFTFTTETGIHAMKKFIAALAIAFCIATLASCNLAEQTATLSQPRNFGFSFKKLPAGMTLAEAKIHMERKGGLPGAYELIEENSDEFNIDPNNFLRFRLTAREASSSNNGQLLINVADPESIGFTPDGPTGAIVDVRPMPVVGNGDTSYLADLHFFITESGVRQEYTNLSDPNSYFKFVLKSFDPESRLTAFHTPTNMATGWFEGLVQAPSGSLHAGEIFAITGGGFSMEITQ